MRRIQRAIAAVLATLAFGIALGAAPAIADDSTSGPPRCCVT